MSKLLIGILLCLALVLHCSYVAGDENSKVPAQEADLPVDLEDAEHVTMDSDIGDDHDDDDDDADDDVDEDDEEYDDVHDETQNVEDLKEWFKSVDSNSDAKISLEELRATFAADDSKEKIDHSDAENGFASMDKDGNGFVTMEEWLAFYVQAAQDAEYENGERSPLTPKQRQHFRQRFDTYDLDKSSSLSLAEFTALTLGDDPEMTQDNAKSLFSEFDSDNNGFLSFEEWIGEAHDDPKTAEGEVGNQNADAGAELQRNAKAAAEAESGKVSNN